MSRIVKNIYIDLESLLDIRQGFLALGAQDNASLTNYLLSDEYLFRKSDQFSFDEDELFFKLRDKGDRRLLKNAQISYMIIILNRELRTMNIKASIDGRVSEKGIIVNTYPFSFNDDELSLMRDAIFEHAGEEVFIKFCHEPPEGINVVFIESNLIDTLFIYRFDEWVNANTDGFMTGILNDKMFYFPEIVRNYELDEKAKEALTTLEKYGMDDQFEVNRLLLSPFLKVEFVPILFYSNYVLTKAYLEDHIDDKLDDFNEENLGVTDIREELLNE